MTPRAWRSVLNRRRARDHGDRNTSAEDRGVRNRGVDRTMVQAGRRPVSLDEPLVEIETDGTTVEVTAPATKCFVDVGNMNAEDVIHWVTDRQETEFKRLGLEFSGLFGRRLQPIDCQNLFCEISKYARVAHPDISGVAKRKRIKQSYKPSNMPAPPPRFPERWGLNTDSILPKPGKVHNETLQPSFF